MHDKQAKTNKNILGQPSTGFDPKIEAAIQDICMWLLHSRSEPCRYSWKMLALKSHKTHFCKKENSINLLIFGILKVFCRVWSHINLEEKRTTFSNCFLSLPSWRPPSLTGSSLFSSLKQRTVERFPILKIFDKLTQDNPSRLQFCQASSFGELVLYHQNSQNFSELSDCSPK